MAFSASDAAFEGFRLVRRNPLALVAWTLVYAVLSLASLAAVSGMMDDFVRLSEAANALEAQAAPDLSQFWALMAQFGQMLLQISWLAPVSVVASAVLGAAVARGVLNPKAGGFGYLRLGMDELRVVGVTLVLTILMVVAVAVVVLVGGVAVGLTAAVSAPAWGALIGLVVMLAGACLTIWLSVRFSLAVPMTVAENRFALFDSFALTKGRFWPLLGMAVIAVVMTLIISFLSSIVTMPLGMMSGMQGWTFGPDSDPEALRAALDVSNPWVIASSLVEAVISALTVGVLYAPFAAAYRDIKGLGAETPTA